VKAVKPLEQFPNPKRVPNVSVSDVQYKRTLLKYLDTACGVRSKDSNMFFVPIKQGKNDITAKAISSWICNTVMLAYLQELLYPETR
jgi:hypothetical protein